MGRPSLMKPLQNLAFFKLGKPAGGTHAEDTRVLALFRNRAELKKAYAGLQEEIYHLKDLIKLQEAETQRAQDMMSALEARLGAAETAYPTLVFYQLRRLWQSGRDLLTQFVADLVRQQEERERRVHLAQHNRQGFERREAGESELRSAQALHLEAGEQLAALEHQRAGLQRWWHYFKRRALVRRMHAARAALAMATATLAETQASLAAIDTEGAPDFPGLSLSARRAINIAAIAYAEVLCQRLTALKSPLLALAREATARREAGPDYGSPQECVRLMGEISRALQLLADRTGLAGQIGECSARLNALARYRSA
ncbi:MAG: hypothetical protein JOZ89_01980, partial [Gammaproteobacteria bacterium]|nr:hypothetical protein [Gammaproteobacteria bacterium]